MSFDTELLEIGVPTIRTGDEAEWEMVRAKYLHSVDITRGYGAMHLAPRDMAILIGLSLTDYDISEWVYSNVALMDDPVQYFYMYYIELRLQYLAYKFR